ncbi:MAG: aldo/keto reductase [Solirubrobacterales bacterium]
MEIDDLAFGCGPIGSYAADGDVGTGKAALESALKAGVRRFDAAPSYGDGQSEALLGAALSGWAGQRSGGASTKIAVSTKVGRTAMANANPYARPLDAGAPRGGGGYDFSAEGARGALVAGLGRLGLPLVDVLFLHDPDLAMNQARAEAMPELARLRDEGLAGAIGVATTNPDVALAFVEEGTVEYVMIAAAWSLTRREAGPLLDRCAERGVTVQAAGPFDSGLLATARPNPAAASGYRAATPARLEAANALADLCERHGVTLPQAALQFPTRHPAVATVVVGMRSPAEVEADLALIAEPVPEELWEEIDRLVDGVG